MYKDLKGIPSKLTQHQIELDTTLPLTHQARYKLNPNYATTIKLDIDRFLAIGFIQHVEEATWLSPIVVILKKNGKLKIYVDLRKLNFTTKKDPFPLPFRDEVFNTMVGCEAYSFMDGYFGYHQIL
jgi:hypothetical protein